MSDYGFVSDIARRISQETGRQISPRLISELFYTRRLDESQAPITAGRRLVPFSMVPQIIELLQKSGHLPAAEVAGGR